MPHPLSTISNLYYHNIIAFLPLYYQTRSLSSKRQEPITENILTSNHLNRILTPAKARGKYFFSPAVWSGDLQIKSLGAMPAYVQYEAGSRKANCLGSVIEVKSRKKNCMALPVWPLLCLVPHLTLFICKSISQCIWVMACQ